MILGLGVDILSLTRFESVIARRGVQRVARRVCCARELADFHTKFGTDRQIWTTRDDAFSFSPASEAEAAFQENEAIKRRAVRFLSSRWAIKEAAYKALTPSLPLLRSLQPEYRLTFHSFDLVHSRGAPRLDIVRLADGNSETGRLEGISLLSSLSHDAGLVVGVVLAQQVAANSG